MQLNNLFNKILISLLASSSISYLSSAIDEDINAKSGLALKQYAQGFKQQAIALIAQIGAAEAIDAETAAYTNCFTASGLIMGGAAEKAADYNPYFDRLKVKAIGKFSTFMQREYADGQFLHDDVVVGGDNPLLRPRDRSRAEFIAFGTRVITGLTVESSLVGLFRLRGGLPADNTAGERTRFTEGLYRYTVNTLGNAIQALIEPDAVSSNFFHAEELRQKCSGDYLDERVQFFLPLLNAAM